jgi:hypothetical protein
MSLGPQGGRALLAAMWRLALSRQQLLLVAVAMVLLDASALAAAIGALKELNTFGDFSSAVYDESRTLADALGKATGGNGACAAAVVLYVFARPWPLAWIRASYIRALCTAKGFPRPTWPSVLRLALLDFLVGTPLAFGIGGLEKADKAALGAPLLLIALVFTLYTDYAIVVDDLGLVQAFRASLHVLKRRPAASLGVTAGWLMLSFTLAAALGPTFDRGATPLALTALLVFTGILGFALDVCLITLYRATPPPPPSARDFA